MRTILITICARGGSKGLPNKNLLPICGKPLVSITIEHANKIAKEITNQSTKVLTGLSSDSENILHYGFNHLDIVRKRPENLASDDAGKIEAIKDLLLSSENELNSKFDIIIDLDVTAPEREVDDIIHGLTLLDSDTNIDLVMSANYASKNPYFNMVEKDPKHTFKICKESLGYLRRQDAPVVYELSASFYIYKRAFFAANYKRVTDSNFSIQVQKNRSIDIDSFEDYQYVKYRLEQNYEV